VPDMLRPNSKSKRSVPRGVVRVWPIDVRDPDAFFRDVIDVIDAPIVLLAEDGRIVRANHAFVRLIGPVDDGTDRMFRELLISRADQTAMTRAMAAAHRSAQTIAVEASVRSVAGPPRRVVWAITGLRGSTRVLAAGRDVTEVRKLESAMTAIEEVGRILGVLGPTPDALQMVIERLVDRLGYPFVALYFLEDEVLRLGAQSGFGESEYEIQSGRGVMSRAIRTGKTQFVPDVRKDKSFISTGWPVQGEISAPLIVDGKPFGVLNVETAETDARLDQGDVSLLQSVAERLASAIVLGRERVELAQRAEALRASEEHTRSIIEQARDAYVEMDAAGLVVEWNPEATRLFGWLRDEVLGKHLYTVVGAEQGSAELGAVDGSLTEGAPSRQLEFTAATHGGGGFPAEMTLWPIQVNGETHTVALIRDITSRKSFEQQLREDALRDALTGLANRTLFEERVELAMSARKSNGMAAAVLFIDLDDFKLVNDTHGHNAGDKVLLSVAQQLRQGVRPGDTVARIGGDEFAVLLEQPATTDQAVALGQRLSAALAAPHFIDGQELFIRASIGVAVSDAPASGSEDLLRHADAAMYVAKKGRIGGVTLYASWMRRDAPGGLATKR
jgi:diguanylate cyclase (GGDEF)-like protein/PAS domain S-box-containing protein